MARTHLLILGSPRSGTTLLASMIGGHPKISVIVEDLRMQMVNLAGKPVVANKLCIPNQVDLHARSTRLRRLTRAGTGQLGWWLEQRLTVPVFGPAAHHSIMDHLELENARLIGILRRAGPTVASMVGRGGASRKVAVFRWSRAIEVLSELTETAGDRVLLLAYEKLIDAPEHQMRRAADFLGVEYEATMVDGAAYNPIYPDQRSIKRPVTPDRTDTSTPGVPASTIATYERLMTLT